MLLEPSIEKLKVKVAIQSTSPQLGVVKVVLLSAIDALSPDRHCKQVTKSLVKRAVEVVEKISGYAETAEESSLLKLVAELESTLRDIHLLIKLTSKRDIFFHILHRKHDYEARSVDLKIKLEKLLESITPEHGSSLTQLTPLASEKSAECISPSFFAGANGVMANESVFYNICGNMTLNSFPNNNARGETESGPYRVIAHEDIILTKEIYKGRGYRLHSAQRSGMAVAVKVYEKSDSRERCLKAAKFHSNIMHPNIPQVIGISPANFGVSFLVINGEYEGAMESLVSFALANDIKRGLMMGLRMVAGLSSGLDYLRSMDFPFASAVLDDFVVLVGQGSKILISFDANGDNAEENDQESETPDDMDQGLSIFNGLCQKTFDAACKAHYDRKQIQRAVDREFDLDYVRFEELDEDEQPSSSSAQRSSGSSAGPSAGPSTGPSFQRKRTMPATGQRRELVWNPHVDETVTLEDISRKFNGVLNGMTIGYGMMLKRRRGLPTPGAVHRCPGYAREEIMLSTDIDRIAIVSHHTPMPHEICPVCKMVVKSAEIFNCSCGGRDHESFPTIRCSTCSEWHHRPCVDESKISNNTFICQRCGPTKFIQKNLSLGRDGGEPSPTMRSLQCSICFKRHHQLHEDDSKVSNICRECRRKTASHSYVEHYEEPSRPTVTVIAPPLPMVYPQTSKDGSPILFFVKSLFDYKATLDDEFDFFYGDIIAVTSTPDDGWWFGELLDETRSQGEGKVFPSNFVIFLKESAEQRVEYDLAVAISKEVQLSATVDSGLAID